MIHYLPSVGPKQFFVLAHQGNTHKTYQPKEKMKNTLTLCSLVMPRRCKFECNPYRSYLIKLSTWPSSISFPPRSVGLLESYFLHP